MGGRRRSWPFKLHVLPNKELETAAQTCLNRRLVNLTVPLTVGSRGIATCFQVSYPEHFLLLVRFGERTRSEKEKRDYPEELPIDGLSPFLPQWICHKKTPLKIAFGGRVMAASVSFLLQGSSRFDSFHGG
jgi:hypothetical protein